MRTRRHPRDHTGLLPFPERQPTPAATAVAPRHRPILPLPRIAVDLALEIRQPIARATANAAALARSRRYGFYLDVFGASFFMALFVAAAILA